MDASVHVLVPVYNGLPYLKEAVESVFDQTRPDWRLHLIDDGSTDGSREVLLSYTDSRVEIVHNDRNRGLYGSLVQAILRLPWGWVVILMQDDRLKPSYLEEMLSLAARHPDCRAFWAAIDTIDATGARIRNGLDTDRVEIVEPGTESWLGALRRGCFWTISGSLTDSKLLLELPFAADYPHAADYDWLLRVLLRHRLVYYERPLTEIRMHEAQTSTRHLYRGQDIQEAYAILRANCNEHTDRLDRTVVWQVGSGRARSTLRRAAAAIAHNRPRYALHLLRYAAHFALLPWTHAPRSSGPIDRDRHHTQ